MIQTIKYFFLLLLFIQCAFNLYAQQSFVLSYAFGAFKNAQRISLDNFNHIFVSDASANTITRFGFDGTEQKLIGGLGWGENQFDQPIGIDAQFGIELYVADYGNHRIQRFDGNLNYIATFSTRDIPEATLSFGYPKDVALTRLGDLYIIDSENNRIIKVNSFSAIERTFGSIESGRGQLQSPRRIHVGKDDNIYILEKDRIVIFDTFGTFLTEIGSEIIKDANGFCIDNDRIYIVSNDHCVVLKTDGSVVQSIDRRYFLGTDSRDSFHDITTTTQSVIILTSTQVLIFQKPT